MAKKIYLDYAAATPVHKEVMLAMRPFFSKQFANPGSIHSSGADVSMKVSSARDSISKILSCSASELIFTSSGSESINLAVQGVARAHGQGHIITALCEHPATLRCCEWLEAQGFQVTYLKPDSTGKISAKKLQDAIQENTILVSLSYANNEVGTINPVSELSKVTKRFNIPFHLDACQAATTLLLNVKDLGVDLMTLNSSKCYGPKGVALLYVKKGVKIKPLIFGGKQEFSLRAGTSNVPGIIGFAKALELSEHKKTNESKRLRKIQGQLIEQLSKLPDAYINGHKIDRLASNVNISFLGVDSETLVLALSSLGLFVSNGSACSQGSVKSSHVLESLGHDRYRSQSSIRISLGHFVTLGDVGHIVKTITGTVSSLRKVSKRKD